MILFTITIFTLIEVILISLLFKLNRIKKNVWQKISFLYNNIYKMLILDYYSSYNNSLKSEIIDYYNNVVNNKDIISKNKKWKDFKEFIINYFNNDKKICIMFDDIKWNIDKNYIIIDNAIHNIIYAIIIVIVLLIGILYIIK